MSRIGFNNAESQALIHIGMIGAGHIARSHARVRQAEARGVAVCSRQRCKAEALAREFGIPQVCEHAEGLIRRDDVDIVSIATPHHLHHPFGMAAMDAGKPVFCEKPLALTYREARAMWTHAQHTGVKTGVQFGMRVRWAALPLAS